ncbi:hypothetical protein AB6A40_000932 [Gnathostoma spinigerum]|uniref:KRIT N-terminal NPxY motif-rich region domain-containing protein n=1 Tax=Gnathostoma spinigerum TaxID=75299 RepID=A0ABD6E374_9BILA
MQSTEAYIAVVQLRQSAFIDLRRCTSADLDIFIMPEPPSPALPVRRYTLPKCRLNYQQLPLDVIRAVAQNFSKRTVRRAVEVPLYYENTSLTTCIDPQKSFDVLYCVPVLENEQEIGTSETGGVFVGLDFLLRESDPNSEAYSMARKDLLIQLLRWLMEGHRRDPHFIPSLFVRAPALGRIRACAHNPAYNPEQLMACHRVISDGRRSEITKRTCDLAEEIRKRNYITARMISDEKYDMFVINPLFGSGLRHPADDKVPTYYAKDRIVVENGATASSSSLQNWSARFPLHKAAYDNAATTVKYVLHDLSKITLNVISNER